MREESHQFLRDGLEFVREGLLDDKTLHRIFRLRAAHVHSTGTHAASILRELAKIQLAIGLFGAFYEISQQAPGRPFPGPFARCGVRVQAVQPQKWIGTRHRKMTKPIVAWPYVWKGTPRAEHLPRTVCHFRCPLPII